jgi:hypothetical protein
LIEDLLAERDVPSFDVLAATEDDRIHAELEPGGQPIGATII